MKKVDYSNNFISGRSSTKVIHAPGGGSSIGSLLFGGGDNRSNGSKQQEKQEKQEQQEQQEQQQQEEEAQREERNKENRNNNEAITIIDGVINDLKTKPINNEESKCTESSSDAAKVREFTFEAGQTTPDKPQLMNLDQVNFITKMIIDELLELYSTVLPPEMAKNAMKGMIENAKCITKMSVSPNESHKLIAEQADAFVDIWYYSLNCMAKKGVNCSKIFDLVHNANMAKRDPQTGHFIKRADGKIIKPKGWKAPDVCAEIKNQLQYGSWD